MRALSFPLYEMLRIGKFMETDSRFDITRGWGRGSGELGFNGYRASVWDDEKVLEMDSGDGDRTLECT